MNSLKKILLSVFGLFIAIIIILIAIPFFVDINQHKPKIEHALKEYTNIDAKIQGDIELSLFPWIGIGLNSLIINDPAEFGSSPLLQAKNIKINAKLIPLLKKNLDMKMVTLDGVTIKLITLKDGSTNLDHLTQSEVTPSPTQSTQQPPQTPKNTENSTSPLAALTLGGIAIKNAAVTYKDATTQTDMQIESFNLKTGHISFEDPISLSSNAIIHSRDTESDATVSMTATITLSKDMQSIDLKKLSIESKLENKQLPTPLSVALTGSSQIDLKRQTLQTEIAIKTDDMHLKIAAKGSNIIDSPAMHGTIQIDPFNARTLAEKFSGKLDMADTEALKSVAFSTQFNATDKTINLKKINFTLDQTVFHGSSQISLEKSHYTFNLNANTLNLDKYLPPTSNDAETPSNTSTTNDTASTTQQSIDAELLPVETLRDLSLNGTFTLESLIISGIELKNISINSSAKNGIINVSPLKASLYDGSVENNLAVNVQGKIPVITISNIISNVQAGPLGKALMEKELVTGTANLTANFKTQGNSEQSLQNALNGKMHFNFTDGAIQGVNIAETIRQAKAKLKGQSLPPSNAPKKTDFTELVGDVSIRNMKVYNENLTMKSPYLRIKGHGEIDLNQETINYLTDVKITGSSTGQTGKDLQDLTGLTIPIRVGGTFDKPSYYPDLKRVIKKQATKKAKQQLKKQLQKKIGIDLRKLF